jgi:hypothetical protein
MAVMGKRRRQVIFIRRDIRTLTIAHILLLTLRPDDPQGLAFSFSLHCRIFP